jgi:hypothetical protein
MRLSRQLAVSLALCAMMLRSLLPDGWMPAANAGTSPLVICSIDGVHTGGKAPKSEDRRDHAPCAFAAMGHASAPAPFATSILPSDIVRAFAADWGSEPVIARLAARTNTARAPPSFG